jgi:16S rRNA (cytidine1402-2'-O)-methyltransferase
MLYLVATPIGHLDDLTLRALEILKSVDLIASEDTRKTGRLLARYGIATRQVAYHEHNEERATPRLLSMLAGGKSVALVTNAGTPGIADPGYRLVRSAAEAGVPVTMAPGPCALIMALVLSGLPVHAFTFRGFPPRRPGPRRRFLEEDRLLPHTLVYYESPHRLEALITEALAVFGDREAALANDLTKRYESVERRRLSGLLAHVRSGPPRGEYILVISGEEKRVVAD